MTTTERLPLTINLHDEWPARIGKFIFDLAEWYAAHPKLADHSAADIAGYLESVAFDQGSIHEACRISVNRDAAGRTEHTFYSSINFNHLRSTLAVAAFERYGKAD